MESKKAKTEYPSSGKSEYNFIDFITYKDKTICGLEDIQNVEVEKPDGKKVIKVKCQPAKGNGTLYLIDSLSSVMSLLGPIGNSMKSSYPGNCVVILFYYSKSCAGSSLVIPHYNSLARHFPDIKVGAIDAFEFPVLNTEFGIIGIPTIMLFHQGRAITKFNNTSATVNNFIKFIQKHTNLKPKPGKVFVTSSDFSEPLSSSIEYATDYYLYLSWIFIITCGTYYFSKSKLFIHLVEILKRYIFYLNS